MHFFNSHERAKSYLSNWKGRRCETDKIAVMTYPLSMSSTNQPVSCVVSWVTRMYFACSFCCCMMTQLFLLLPPKNELISKFLVLCTVHEAIHSMGVRCITLPSLQFWSMSDIHHCRQVCMVNQVGTVWAKVCIMYVLSFLYSGQAKPHSQAHDVDWLTSTLCAKYESLCRFSSPLHFVWVCCFFFLISKFKPYQWLGVNCYVFPIWIIIVLALLCTKTERGSISKWRYT